MTLCRTMKKKLFILTIGLILYITPAYIFSLYDKSGIGTGVWLVGSWGLIIPIMIWLNDD